MSSVAEHREWITSVLADEGTEDPEACPSDPPTAPNPTAPPFQPQPVEVALGASGNSITLMTTEAGGFTLNGEAVETGAIHAAANGNYTLTLSGGTWTATFAPMMHELMLGASGNSVTIVQMETGGYSLNGKAITADTTAMASNGALYGVDLGPSGPVAVYISSSVTVMLGDGDGEITLTLAEDQMTYMRDGTVFVSGTVVTSNNRSYTVSMINGVWRAVLRP